MPNNLWDHDLWQDIYSIQDAETKRAVIRLYRLVLDMRESDVLAQKVADAVSRRDKLILTVGQKVVVLAGSFLILVDTALHIATYLK